MAHRCNAAHYWGGILTGKKTSMTSSPSPAQNSFDAFAEFGLPRQVDLEVEVIEDKWRELSRSVHPDAEGGDADRAAAVNQAHQLLVAPGSRLRHWLELHGRSARDAAMDDQMMLFFSQVGGSLQVADEVLKKRSAATTAMGRAVLATAEWESQARLQKLLGELGEAIAAAIARFPEIDAAGEEGDFGLAESTAARLGFFEKWQAQIRERLVALMAD